MSGGGRAAIFVNEGAGSARSARVRESVDLARRALGADLHVTSTRDPDALRRFLEERVEGYATAVVAGGDGSFGVALNVAAPRAIAVGYIPAGFGNATAHLLRLPREPAALVSVLAAADARALDLVRVDGRLALFAGAGWDAVVAGRYARGGARRMVGWASAVLESSGDLVHRHRVEVSVDGTTIHAGPMELLVVGTTPFYGRGLVVNPGASPSSGRLMVRVYRGPVAGLALEAARWILHRRPATRGFAGIGVTVSALDGRPLPLQADGDLLGERARWEVALAPAAVRVIGAW